LANRPAPSTGSTTTYNYDDDLLDEEDREKVGSYYDS